MYNKWKFTEGTFGSSGLEWSLISASSLPYIVSMNRKNPTQYKLPRQSSCKLWKIMQTKRKVLLQGCSWTNTDHHIHFLNESKHRRTPTMTVACILIYLSLSYIFSFCFTLLIINTIIYLLDRVQWLIPPCHQIGVSKVGNMFIINC